MGCEYKPVANHRLFLTGADFNSAPNFTSLIWCKRQGGAFRFKYAPVAEYIWIGGKTVGPLVQGRLEDVIPVCL